MAGKAIHYSVPSPTPEKLLNINNFAGINLDVTPTQIADNESPDMLNMFLTDSGRLEKRTGYDTLLNLGSQINGMCVFNGKVLIASGTHLFEFEEGEI